MTLRRVSVCDKGAPVACGVPLSMMIAVSGLLRAYPSLSIGLKPSNGGSLTFQMRAGGGLGGLRPEAAGASLVAEGAMVLVTWW